MDCADSTQARSSTRLTPSFEAKNRAQIQNVAKTPNPMRAAVRKDRTGFAGGGWRRGGCLHVSYVRGIHSDWLDGPKVNSKWQFPAHSDNDAFNVLLGGGYARCHRAERSGRMPSVVSVALLTTWRSGSPTISTKIENCDISSPRLVMSMAILMLVPSGEH